MRELPETFGSDRPEFATDTPLGAGLHADLAHGRYPETMRLPDEGPTAEEEGTGPEIPLSAESVDAAHDAIIDAGFGDELRKATREAGSAEGGLSAFFDRYPTFRRVVRALEVSLALFSAAPATTASAETIFAKAGDRMERQVERGILGGVNRSAKQATDYIVREATGPIDDMVRGQNRRIQEKRRAETGLRSAERNAERAILSFRGKIEALHDEFGRDWVEEKNRPALASDGRRSSSLRENENRRLGALCQSYLGKVDAAETAFKSRMRTVDRDLFSVLRDGSGATRREAEGVIVGKERAQEEVFRRSAMLRAALEKKMRSLLGVGAENFENPLDETPSSAVRYRDAGPASVRTAVPRMPSAGSESGREVHVDDLDMLLQKL